jgi:hypothetical protein
LGAFWVPFEVLVKNEMLFLPGGKPAYIEYTLEEMSSPVTKYEVIDLTDEPETTTVDTTAKEVQKQEVQEEEKEEEEKEEEEKEEEESDDEPPQKRQKPNCDTVCDCDSDSDCDSDCDSDSDSDSDDSDRTFEPYDAERDRWVKNVLYRRYYKMAFAANTAKGMSQETAHELSVWQAHKDSCFYRHLSEGMDEDEAEEESTKHADYKKERAAYKARNLSKGDAGYDSYYEDSDY